MDAGDKIWVVESEGLIWRSQLSRHIAYRRGKGRGFIHIYDQWHSDHRYHFDDWLSGGAMERSEMGASNFIWTVRWVIRLDGCNLIAILRRGGAMGASLFIMRMLICDGRCDRLWIVDAGRVNGWLRLNRCIASGRTWGAGLISLRLPTADGKGCDRIWAVGSEGLIRRPQSNRCIADWRGLWVWASVDLR